MSSVVVRPFRRSDRDQLTQLVNTHAGAVVPGISVSVSTVLAALERQPGEFIEDPWVNERVTLVAEQRDRIAAAAHLLRYFPDGRAGTAARDTGEIHWLLFWPGTPAGYPCWPGATGAADVLMAACLRQLERWGVTRQHAGGELPVRGVYGVPGQWPHISELYQRAGFAHTGHTEIIYLARVGDLPRPAGVPIDGLSLRRPAGLNGTRLSAVLGGDVIGYIEVDTFGEGERLSRHGGWAGTAAAAWRHGCSGRQLTGCSWRALTGFSTTPGSTVPTRGPGLRGLPGLPPGGRVSGTHPDQARGWSRTPGA